MARRLLKASSVRSLLLVLALVTATFAARASDVDDGTARVTALEQRVRALGVERRALAQAYDEKTAEVARLKAQPSAWGRDRKLQALLAESQDMAGALDRKDADVRAAGAALDRAKESLLGAVDAELGLAGDAAPTAERAATLRELRHRLAAALVKPMHLADERIEPGDDAEDLELKASALAQNETALAAELDRLKARTAYFRRQAKLTKSRARADEQDVFREEEAHVPGRPNTTPSRSTSNDSAPPGTVPGGPIQIGGNPAASGPARGLDLAADPSVVLADVLASGTVDDLRRAERSGDPESLARSAEHAARELAERAEKLHQHRLEMLERAKKLRGGP